MIASLKQWIERAFQAARSVLGRSGKGTDAH